MNVQIYFTHNIIPWVSRPASFVYQLKWFLFAVIHVTPHPPIKVFTVNFLWRKSKKRSKIILQHWKLDVTAFALSCHQIELPESQWLTIWGAPITLEGEAAAMAGSVTASNSSSKTPNAAYDSSLLVLTLIFVCHSLKNHTMK